MRPSSIAKFVSISCLVFAATQSHAGMIFSGGWVESRAYSGLTPTIPTDRKHEEVNALPFELETSARVGDTSNETDHLLRTLANGSEFRWGLNQAHDGGPFSFAISEGELAFQVTETSQFLLQGDYVFSGPGVKRAFFRLYDSPADANPVFQWDQESHLTASSFAPQEAGDLHPGVGYRLAYRLLLDNHTLADAGATAGNLRFSIGEPERDGLTGDTDGNARIDVNDLNHVRNNFGQQGDPVLGDAFPFDGRVDIKDLNAVRNFFGTVRPQAVPEPNGLGLAVLGSAALAVLRRRRHSLNK
jgi:hypothetical protein